MQFKCYLHFIECYLYLSGSFCFEGPDEVVGPEGMEKFCEDIGVEPENVRFYDTSNPLKGVTGLVDLVLYTDLNFNKQSVMYLRSGVVLRFCLNTSIMCSCCLFLFILL